MRSVLDFYARLEVDPAAERAVIEAAVARKQPQWSMGTRNPKTRHLNQLFLDEIPLLRRSLLGDAASRAAYDAELRATRRLERDAKLKQLERMVRLRAAKGGLRAADHGALREEAARLGLEEAELIQTTHLVPALDEPVGVENGNGVDAEPPADVLDGSMRRQIRVSLEHLGCRDLYDALGVARDAPASDVLGRADLERQRWMKKAQVTAEKTAWLEVITHAQSNFGSPKQRLRYDRTLALESEEAFDSLAEFTLKGLSRLDEGSRATLLEEASGLGIAADRAERLIARACKRLGIEHEIGVSSSRNGQARGQAAVEAVSGASNGRAKFTVVRCRECAGFNELSAVARKAATGRCRHCGASLKWSCPLCKRTAWVDEHRCFCGFRQVMREPLTRHFEAAQQAFRNFDLEGSIGHLARVEEIAPGFSGVRNGLVKIRKRAAAIQRFKLAYETARAGGRLIAAKAALEVWSRLTSPASGEIQSAWSELARGLRQAEALAAHARKLERTNPSAAREHYRKSLEIATDLHVAMEGLGRTPPDPPTALDGAVLGDRIRLTWTPPAPDGLGACTYVVVRKRGGTLEHPGDGTRIAEVSSCDFDDMHVGPGETVGYAVLSKRGGSESVGAISLGPFVYLADVKDVHVEASTTEVHLHWETPRGATAVRVTRKRGLPPRDPGDGERMPAALDQVIDRDLAANEIYFYKIYAVYRMGDGRLFPSPGVVATARPQAAFSTPDGPRIVQDGPGRIRVEWLEPARGSIQILRTERPIALAAGTQLSDSEAKALEGTWLEAVRPDQAYDHAPPENGCFYTTMGAWGGRWIVGQTATLSRVSDPIDLRATRAGISQPTAGSGSRATLRWSWASEATGALIVAKLGREPEGPSDPAAVVMAVTRPEYVRQDCWVINLPGQVTNDVSSGKPPKDGFWHVRVYSTVELDGGRSISAGLEKTAATIVPGGHAEVTVSYAIGRPRLPGLRWGVTFRTEPAGSAVPPMVVVAHARAVPTSAEDGVIVGRLPASRDGARVAFRSRSKLSRLSLRIFPDPGAEPNLAIPVRLRHPEDGASRV